MSFASAGCPLSSNTAGLRPKAGKNEDSEDAFDYKTYEPVF